MKIDLQSAIVALTGALDFVGVDEVHHGKRVALIAAAIADELGWDAPAVHDLLYAGMLHDCGVSRHREHRQLTETLEWEGAQEHCLRGEEFLLACPPLARFAPAIRWHHTRWEHLPDTGLGEAERLVTNLLFLADRTDVLFVPYLSGQALHDRILWEFPQIVGRLGAMAGTLFAPVLVTAFARAAARESFWLALDPTYLEAELADRMRGARPVELGAGDALAVARLFARTVDAKSNYTLEHSTRVARIARFLGQASGASGDTLDQLEIAGLLHDIGKLRVSEEIIDKPATLTREERAAVTRHSYDTGHILRKVFPGQPIARWAAMHHENLLGSGYPRHIAAAGIPREARLIAVADIFQACCQERPYRRRLAAGEVMAELDALSAAGRIDAEMVELVRSRLAACYALAIGAE